MNAQEMIERVVAGESAKGVIEEGILSGSSALASSLIDFINKRKVEADDLIKFIRFKLISELQKVTLKGAALAVGMDVKMDAPSSAYSLKEIKRFVAERREKKDKESYPSGVLTLLANHHGIFITEEVLDQKEVVEATADKKLFLDVLVAMNALSAGVKGEGNKSEFAKFWIYLKGKVAEAKKSDG